MIKNVIFDFYGTLVDCWTDESKEGFFEAVEKEFKKIKDFNGDLKARYLELCAEKQEKIEDLKSYKSSLINEYVTFKKQVPYEW